MLAQVTCKVGGFDGRPKRSRCSGEMDGHEAITQVQSTSPVCPHFFLPGKLRGPFHALKKLRPGLLQKVPAVEWCPH
jgi:hypothetical protein